MARTETDERQRLQNAVPDTAARRRGAEQAIPPWLPSSPGAGVDAIQRISPDSGRPALVA